MAAESVSQAIRSIKSVLPSEPDLIEMRLDYLTSLEGLEKVRKATDLPLIATNRRRDQGGLNAGPEPRRIRTLLDACEIGFDYVDLEMTTASVGLVAEDVRKRGSKLIVSRHDIKGTSPKEAMQQVLENEQDMDPDLCKIVGTANSHEDNLVYLNFLTENADVELICFGMGEKGVLSRILSPLFGGAFTYASVNEDTRSAPGQMTITELREIYRRLGV